MHLLPSIWTPDTLANAAARVCRRQDAFTFFSLAFPPFPALTARSVLVFLDSDSTYKYPLAWPREKAGNRGPFLSLSRPSTYRTNDSPCLFPAAAASLPLVEMSHNLLLPRMCSPTSSYPR